MHAPRLRLVERCPGHSHALGLNQRFAHLPAQGQPEGVRHRPANEECIRLFQQTIDHFDLFGNFRSSQDDDEWPRRVFQLVAQEFQLPLHQQPGRAFSATCGHHPGHAFGRGVGPVRRAEGVVYVQVRDLRQFLREHRVVGLFLTVIADIFQQQEIPGLERVCRFLDLFANTVIDEGDRSMNQVSQFHRHGPQRQ